MAARKKARKATKSKTTVKRRKPAAAAKRRKPASRRRAPVARKRRAKRRASPSAMFWANLARPAAKKAAKKPKRRAAKKSAAGKRPMTKAAIASAIATKVGAPKSVIADALAELPVLASSQLKSSGSFQIHGLAKLKVAKTKARRFKAPNGKVYNVKAGKTVRCRAGSAVKDAVRGASAKRKTAKKKASKRRRA